MRIIVTIALIFNMIGVSAQNNLPKVKLDATYNVIVKKDVTYAEGLTHDTINSVFSKKTPLKLDVYFPDNAEINRPTILLIHGGGFSGGYKEHMRIVDMANYFASRGWVAFSINYRLRKHKGTVPENWVNYSSTNLDPQFSSKFLSMYPAIRDAKAALRWVCANAETYYINTNYITVGGASAGAISAIALGLSDNNDFTNEISLKKDPTLKTTNLNQLYKVHTIINFWGSSIALNAIEEIKNYKSTKSNKTNIKLDFWGNHKENLKTENSQPLKLPNKTLPPILIIHGENDPIVKFSNAEDLKNLYIKNNALYEFHPIPNAGHGIWNKTSNNKSLNKVSLDFIIEQQKLITQ